MGRDEFLERYGFARATRYELMLDGRRYDSKAIVGVANRYQFPDEAALRPADFSGGDATVKPRLESMGFEVVDVDSPNRNPPWTRDEVILALELYQQEGAVRDDHPKVVALSQLLNSLPVHSAGLRDQTFRNPNGVALKLANFAALDPSYEGRGMRSVSHVDREVWVEFFGQPARVRELAAAIRAEAVRADVSLPMEDED